MMKIITTNTSPYGRKIRILLRLFDLQEGKDYQIDDILPLHRPVELTRYNVLSKIPTLVLADGSSILDSQLITDYLLAHHTSPASQSLIPEGESWQMKNITQIPHGLIEYTINAVMEGRRPEQYQYDGWRDLMYSDMRRILQSIEDNNVPTSTQELTLFSLTLICALDFIDFRLPNFNWKQSYPLLLQWHQEISKLSYIKETYPSAS